MTDLDARARPAVGRDVELPDGVGPDGGGTGSPAGVSRPPLRWRQRVLVIVPALVLVTLFCVPFALMLATSFYRRIEGGFYEPAVVLDSWKRLFSDFYVGRTLYSIRVCLLVAAITTVAAFPFTWFLTRMRARRQVSLLVMILAALTLSEVIVAFSWNLILGRASGITNVLVWVGAMREPRALTPGLAAVVAGLAYIAFPYCVITLFPSLKRIDAELTDAAGTLGATPSRTFRSVVLPLARTSVVAAFLLVFVFTLGSYIVAQVLGRPEHWTLSVFISDQALFNANVPFAAAMAMLLTVISLVVVGGVSLTGARRAREEA